MNLDWIAGFFDGEGCVTLGLHRTQTGRYGYNLQPIADFAQKTRSILEAIQGRLGMGQIYRLRKGWCLKIGRYGDLERLIALLSERVHLKREQLLLLGEALRIIRSQRPVSKENMLRLLDISTKIRHLNGRPKSSRAVNIEHVRKRVLDFDEGDYREQLEAKRKKRVARIAERSRSRVDTARPPRTIRELYWNKWLSAEQIGRHFGCSQSAILRQMRRLSIPRR